MTDLILAISHHLAVFTLVGLFAAEVVVLKPDLPPHRLHQLGLIDAAYGAVAGLVIVVGVLRVIFGASGADYYIHNWVFWAKMAAFVLAGLLSVPPTLAILRWRNSAKTVADYRPPLSAIAMVRRFYFAEGVALAFIPAFAAAMARGYGA